MLTPQRRLLTSIATGTALILTLSLCSQLPITGSFGKESYLHNANIAMAAESPSPGPLSITSNIKNASSFDEMLFVTSQPGAIKLYNITTGEYVRDFIPAENNGGLSNPTDLLFGPDGNLYVFSNDTQIKRYNGTTGAFIDNFVNITSSSQGTTQIGNFVFGPDGNIYVAYGRSFSSEGAPAPQFESVIKRYNGTTGAFIDNFVSNGTGGLFMPKSIAFGPDGNLYASDSKAVNATVDTAPDIKRYNGTTGAFIDEFVSGFVPGRPRSESDSFGHIAIAPNGNLYVLVTPSNILERYNGTSGKLISRVLVGAEGNGRIFFSPHGDYFVSDSSGNSIMHFDWPNEMGFDFIRGANGGLHGPVGMAFGTFPKPPPKPQAHLYIATVDKAGNAFTGGLWAVIRSPADNSILKTGYTPLNFTGTLDSAYEVTVANYDDKTFLHWNDNATDGTVAASSGSNNSTRLITLAANSTHITATYDLGNALRGFTPLTFNGTIGGGTRQSPSLTVNAVLLDSSNGTSIREILHMWTTIDPQQPVNATNTGALIYKVYITNGHNNIVFDHWGDDISNRNSTRTITIHNSTTLTAYYKPISSIVFNQAHLFPTENPETGFASFGEANCPDGSVQSNNIIFQFSAHRAVNQRLWNSFWYADMFAWGHFDRGIINSLQFTNGTTSQEFGSGSTATFEAKGNWTTGYSSIGGPGNGTGTICPHTPVDNTTKVTISGECGTDVYLNFMASNRITGRFFGNVTCSSNG